MGVREGVHWGGDEGISKTRSAIFACPIHD